jgi:hypothetical protein
VLHDPALRDPRGYILSADQPDFPTAVKFVNALIRSGVRVERATAPFDVAGKTYPAGSLVVKTDQAYRPHILDMFEPQDHPTDLAFPGGPPVRPYDVTGYTLAFQMGVQFDRIADGFTGPFETLPDEAAPPPGKVIGTGRAGWIVDHQPNDAFILTNRLLKAKQRVSWLKQGASADGRSFGPGAIWVPATPAAAAIMATATRTLGLDAYAVDAAPTGESIAIKPVRIGLVDLWSGLMPSGWTRWLFEKYEFPFQIVRPQRLDAGKLEKDFDVIVFPDAAYMSRRGMRARNRRPIIQPKPADIPAEYRLLSRHDHREDDPAADRGVRAQRRHFDGDRQLDRAWSICSSCRSAMLCWSPTASRSRRPNSMCPARSCRRRSIPPSRSPTACRPRPTSSTITALVYRVPAGTPGVNKVAWFQGKQVLRSGWAVGQERLDGAAGVLDVNVGKGKLFLYGPEVLQRGAAHGTFKLFFNGLLYGPAASRGR